ncbi:MAG: thioredoxin family protein [Armatimonadota bacterium]|nr:thioredoxin family protein [Armatimonadota bacterium]MDR5676473.1 thioredoxin family protein [Armatimonadota bacterium]MDR5688945.1 thioredoxin family protein [Armatimonadota bacterium]MDR7386409.1 thioredoxin family protein [Armatimonadota bacterium]MDR7388049.1 thioredoxin family protein [Armatimonadota bacterium]
MDWKVKFDQALGYHEFLDRYGSEVHRERWRRVYEAVALTPEQRVLLQGFQRDMYLVVLAGVWCGDCVNQCPILQRFAEATPRIGLRFLDRDEHPDLRELLSINRGYRIPMVVFLSEDFVEVARYGERTLSIYRQMAADRLGPACPVGVVPPGEDLLRRVVQEWLNEVERVQLLLRLSPRLRLVHGD